MCSSSLTIDGVQEQARLNRVVAYLRDHFAETLNLTELARLAGISKFHFHRIFKARYGETPRDYLNRLRLEQAGCRLLASGNASITDIACECGFSDSQHFAHSFSRHFGVPPLLVCNKFDARTLLLKKTKVMESAYGKRHCLPAEVKKEGRFIQLPSVTEEGRNKFGFRELDVVTFPSYRAACIRLLTVPASEAVGQAIQKLSQWSISRRFFMLGAGQLMMAAKFIPNIEGLYTIDVCITIPDNIEVDEDEGIKIRRLPSGLYGVCHGKFRALQEFISAREKLIHGWWLSSYFPRDQRPLYAIIYNSPAEDGSRDWLLDFCLPITILPQ